jgi:ABC-type branched-subunit amino acid transport system ATPase component
MSILDVRGLKSGYGNIGVLFGIDFTVEKGEMVSVLGANGAGKTTLMRTIAGVLPPSAGELWFNGENINKLRADQRTKAGMNYVPQDKNIFADLTVHENLDMGAFFIKDPQAKIEEIYGYFPILKARSRQYAGTLSGGERQMLAVGCALLTSPQLLILDEPSGGLSPQVTHQLIEHIHAINRTGVAIIWVVEENPLEVLAHADRVYLMANGLVAKTSTGRELLDDKDFDRLFLGQQQK